MDFMWLKLCVFYVFLQVLSSLKCSLYAGYLKLKKFPTFIIFLIFSNNPIEGCDLASPGPPDLEHIWGPKWQPVYGLFYITIICNFYEMYELFHKPYRRMRFWSPYGLQIWSIFGVQNCSLYMGY